MNYARIFINILLSALLPCWVFAQDPASNNELDREEQLVESAFSEYSGTSLILDNTRTKFGKDFYDLFYKHWTALQTQSDTSLHNSVVALDLPASGMVIVLEEVPLASMTPNQILIRISIDDNPVWMELVQGRYELLEESTLYALETVQETVRETVRQYVTIHEAMRQYQAKKN